MRVRSPGSIAAAAAGSRSASSAWRAAGPRASSSGLQVEPGAADDDGTPPPVERRVDLGAGERREASRRERLRHRHEREQPVLERPALGGRGRAAQDLEAGVHLKRVGRDRDRVLALPAQPLRQGDGHGRLADAGRAEQGDHVVIRGHDR